MTDLKVTFPEPCSEAWGNMRPHGSNRFCDRCSTTVHDLSRLTVHELDALLASGERICVKAKLDADGALETRPSRTSQRIVASIGISAALLAQSAPLAATGQPSGTIKGSVSETWFVGEVIATNVAGQSFTTRIKEDGKYKLKRLPAGTYAVYVRGGCTSDITTFAAGNVVVRDRTTTVLNARVPEDQQCIVVGQLIRDESDRRG